MSDPEIVRLAERLAGHAVLLLGAGIFSAFLALLAILLVVRILAPVRPLIGRFWRSLLRRANEHPVLDAVVGRTQAWFAGGYLVLHFVLGLTWVAAGSAFLVIAEEVGSRGTLATFDIAFARALRDEVTPGWQRFFADVSWLGNKEAIGVVTLVVAAILWWQQKTLLATGWVAAQAGGGVLNLTLKGAFERTRPEFASPAVASGWSFPSGHAMGTFVLCGLAVYLIVRHTRSVAIWVAAITLSLVWCLAISFSRLYLGVHFASDVMAGMIAGSAWVAVCISALETIQYRRSRLARPRETAGA